ncbi:MAG: hypothetical protein K2N38_12940 [Oscillospiraceae bacterium]|nr:hypothetical protein [Oscillospiraceae bacterium]
MYAVSDAYKEAINGRSRQFKIRAVIYFRDNTVKTFDDSTIEGEVRIESQMMPGSPSDDMIKIGMAASKKLTMTVKNIKTDLHVFAGAWLWLYVSLRLGDGVYEEVPMGKFCINNKSISRVNDLVTFSAYDGMVLLHYELTAAMRRELKGKTALEAAHILCEGLLLVSTAVSPAGGYVECPNADLPLDFDSAQIETARDGIMWIAQLMGCFARVNRLGVLEFVPIKSWWVMYTETVGTILAVRNIGGAQRIRTKFADDRIHIVGVSMRGADNNLVTQRYSYSHSSDEDPTSDVIVEMDSNPLIMNSSTPLSTILSNILEQVSTAYFYAFSTEIPNDPALDEGDTIRLQGGIINGTNKNSDLIGFITHNVWRYRGIQEITNASSVPIIYEDTAASEPSVMSNAAPAGARARAASARSSDERNYLPPKPQSEKALQGRDNSTRLVGNFGRQYVFKWNDPTTIKAQDPNGKDLVSIRMIPGNSDQFFITAGSNSVAFWNDRIEVKHGNAGITLRTSDGQLVVTNKDNLQAMLVSPQDGVLQFNGSGGSFRVELANGTITLNGKTVFKTS